MSETPSTSPRWPRLVRKVRYHGWVLWLAAALLIFAAVFVAMQKPDCQSRNLPQREIMWCAYHAPVDELDRFHDLYKGERVTWRGLLSTEQVDNSDNNYKVGDHITALITNYGAEVDRQGTTRNLHCTIDWHDSRDMRDYIQLFSEKWKGAEVFFSGIIEKLPPEPTELSHCRVLGPVDAFK